MLCTMQPRLACYLTGLGPTSTSDGANGDLGGLYFNGTMIPNSDKSSSIMWFRCNPKGSTAAGVFNIEQCVRS